MVATVTRRPASNIKLFSVEAIRSPYPLYEDLRDLGPCLWLEKEQMYCLPRYHDVKTAIGDWKTFSSASGVVMNNEVHAVLSNGGTSLMADPPLHDQLRKITSAPILPRALQGVRGRTDDTTKTLIDDLLHHKSFDAMQDLAQVLPS